MAELAELPLVLPERTHFIRRLLETRAAMSGHKLRVAYEVSSVPSILELVRAGFGHAVLAESALATHPQPQLFRLRTLVEPGVSSELCLVASAHKAATPLAGHVQRMLRELVVQATVQIALAHGKAR